MPAPLIGSVIFGSIVFGVFVVALIVLTVIVLRPLIAKARADKATWLAQRADPGSPEPEANHSGPEHP